MKYFEKNLEKRADIRHALKGVVEGFKSGKMDLATAGQKIDKVKNAKVRLMQLEHSDWPKFDTPKTQEKIEYLSKVIRGSEMLHNARKLELAKLGAAPVHPMQGTMLNVQTRESQRKYNSKVLGKKRADILVPLWR